MISLPAVPVRVKVPLTVWEVPFVKFIVLPAVVQLKLLKVVSPEIVDAPAPVKTIVEFAPFKVPPVLDQLPETFTLCAPG